ncbi:MAG: response regulator [Proteobacteria bacterium]|nr:response regulator [Pseudomonadota bacterium]
MIRDGTMLNNSVLIVDDDIDALEEMADALQDYGLKIHTASDGDAALMLANEHRPEFILMDYLLHGSTGVETAFAIRKFLPGVQIIMISAFENLNSVVTIKNCGVIAVLRKPLSMNSIGRFISTRLTHKKRQLKSLKN